MERLASLSPVSSQPQAATWTDKVRRGAFLFKENTVSLGDGNLACLGREQELNLSTVLRTSVKVGRKGPNTVIGCHPATRLCLDLLPAICFTLPTVFPSLSGILLM